ncbi:MULTISPECIES: hypothetical protein [Archaeoglobus]|jgi:hypothetical protein|uniref:Uncharacterized protein AF_0586 n=3 Tax=Archaeoglobus fulgidus TaxID=2234 RepID=Y586_ARCFU|nr:MULTISPECIES: hypothetical protein [Archaeoglobus]O29669.1 RecName: Full=Uncharacterized protein AF_0586 [Archaeoglobus fulgidus DSM 4304]AAB90658.1 predicted coding region AF_0586 [Archaeoglobus fulgidus DSM 4304]AIG97462.1 hypothetical protein AFULGI_00006610 [Archaeoglobus fulgidus DSM 8774]KUJ93093.1 MAG: hypothetical protein XD40_1721 [Archaeoglobus fulgidus]KUK06832.1 MAG: Uncharacterized protein XD48_0942 [Archaeoglobus fulgidus]MDI3498040.1 hypothetical protein [Archaeoglobus sp.]
MRGEKLTKKWRLIKLSRMHYSDFAVRFIEEMLEDNERLHDFSVKYGMEKGAEVKRNLHLKDFSDVAEFLSMITGVRVSEKEGGVVFDGCPSREMTEVRKTVICTGFLEGFFKVFGYDVEVNAACGEKCRVEVKKRTSSSR